LGQRNSNWKKKLSKKGKRPHIRTKEPYLGKRDTRRELVPHNVVSHGGRSTRLKERIIST